MSESKKGIIFTQQHLDNLRKPRRKLTCPHCKKENITVHYKEPFKWCVENRENNTFTLNILFFCDSCFQKFEAIEKTGE